MRTAETTLGGSGRAFPSTVWSQVLRAGDASELRSRETRGELLRSYWKPVYAYIRAAWKKPVEDAKDLTQAFFAHLLEKDTLSRVRPGLGTFRGYLKQTLKHFLIDAERAAAARRPATPFIPLDDAPPAPVEESPDRAFDRQWFRDLTASSLESLRARLDREGKGAHAEVFQRYVIDPAYTTAASPTYREVAASLGLTEKDVDHYLRYCSGALLEILRTEIRRTVDSEREVDPEIRRLLAE